MKKVRNYLRFLFLVFMTLTFDAMGGPNPINSIALSEIKAIYGDDGTANERNTQWFGNCGRGKFTYYTLDAKDSNPFTPTKPPSPGGPPLLDPAKRIKDNDIWLSRTGCWNPEERFVFMPPYSTFKRGEDVGVDASKPLRVQKNIVFFEPTGNKNLALIPNSTPYPVKVPIEGPWDEPLEASSGAVSSFLVPNDRLLMPHPLCTNLSNESKDYYSPTGEKLGAIGLEGSHLRNLFEKSDLKRRIYEDGSLPRCLIEDFVDDVDNYCEEYVNTTNALIDKLKDVPGLSGLLDKFMGNKYKAKRYFFDFDNYCWSQPADPKDVPLYFPYDPYEHWMPLAIRSSNQADAVDASGNPIINWGQFERDDYTGTKQTYWATDTRRPTFTDYAERTVYELDVPDINLHTQFSLEEYGYRQTPIRRVDYAFNPNNIYDPSGANITPQELLKLDNIGRKEKMYRCLRTYIEQWAFEGDKGSIYLDQNEYAVRRGAGNDASMCQWVAYYDVSENFKDRKHFKEIMLRYVKDSSKGMGFKITDRVTNDPLGMRELGCHETDDVSIPPKNSDCGTGINALSFTPINTQNTFGFPRKHGMRPEAFDYFNFLTFSAIPAPNNPVSFGLKVGAERYNLTHNVELSGGGASVKEVVGGVPADIQVMDDLYGKLLDISDPESAVSSLVENRINFAKRECKTAIPPQIWNDVIDMNSVVIPQPSGRGCDFQRGARLINQIQVNAGDGPIGVIGDIVDVGVELLYSPILIAINAADPLKRKYKHTLTTIVDAPVLSVTTPIPLLPVTGLGYQYENITLPYIKFASTNPEPLFFGEFRDNMHRAAGAKSLPYHIIQPFGGKRNMFKDTTMGMVVIDEYTITSDLPRGRDWVNQSWPAASCMHSIKLGSTFVYGLVPDVPGTNKNEGYVHDGKFMDIKDDPNDDDLHEGVIYDSWKTYDDIRLDYLAGAYYDYSSSYKFGMKDFAAANERKFGGVRLYRTPATGTGELEYYYKWLPSKWSVGVGIDAAFWCEFELPYFPYFVGPKEVEHNRGKFIQVGDEFVLPGTLGVGDVNAFNKINGQKLLYKAEFGPRPLKPDYKPRLEYYRVERIRDACGPFGIRSTWMDYERNVGTTTDTNYKFFDWFIGDVSDIAVTAGNPNYMKDAKDMNGDQYYHLKSRCDGWIDMYHKKTNDPKAIGWRLARFDYEFMKSFLECTGPYQQGFPKVCQYNDSEYQRNQKQSICQAGFAIGTILEVEVACEAASSACGPFAGLCKKICIELAKKLPANPISVDCGPLAGLFPGCYTFCEGRTTEQQVTDNVARAYDFASRGDHTHFWDDTIEYPHGYEADDPDLDESPGFETWKSNSIKIDKFWLRGAFDSHDVTGDERYGFWCRCEEDKDGWYANLGDTKGMEKSKTTRCREDYCTCEQHVLLPSRQVINGAMAAALIAHLFAKNQWDPPKIDDIWVELIWIAAQATIKPVVFCADYGPFRRWIQCFYQARASACPVLTRDVSDSIPYSSLKDPFTVDKRVKDNVPENTQKRQSYNVCTEGSPTGHGNKDVEGFIRWSLEEPNHLARIPVWFESGAAGFAHEDLIFQSQVRDWEYPFLELAAPFPIDLVTRHCKVWGIRKIDEGDGEVFVEACLGEDMENYTVEYNSGVERGGKQKLNLGFYIKNDNDDSEYPDNLSEIRQREGVGYSQIVYFNPANTLGGEPEKDEFEITNPRFRTTFLRTRDTSVIAPKIDGTQCLFNDMFNNPSLKCDSRKYQELYYKYIKGIYAVAAGFSYREKPEEPGNPTQFSDPADVNSEGTDKQNIHPRAQEKIVGPRGCDIGGWWEMMLYQARCIRWHRLNCICDYDKTFAKGNDVNYALRRAGKTFEVVGPTIEGAKYQKEIRPEQDGTIYAVREDAERKISGEAKNQGSLPGSGKRIDNKIISRNKIDPSTGRPILQTSGIDTRAQYKPGITVLKTPVYYPLKDRGIVGPEFALYNTEPWDDTGHKIKGLNDVMVGDLVIWDEQIEEPLTGLDVGYPRHVAYVEEVNRVSLPSGDKVVMSFKVSEMNWGKLYDSCGNTNKWGVESSRIIHRPTCASDVSSCEFEYNSVDGDPLDGVPTPGSVDKYADCRNADWYHCVEKYWDQVKIYRPYINNDSGKFGDVTMDNVYSGASNSLVECDGPADYPQPISRERIHLLAVAMFEGDPSASPPVSAIHTPADLDLLKPDGKYDPKKVREYIHVAYNEGDLDLDFILYETDLWKLLVTSTDYGKYYNDEVDEFLFNSLKGAADNCDPLPNIRDNYYRVLDDIRIKTGVVK